ncbi:uncharacterized protein PHALS_05377 [Plasmopara halstedii]|uniref:Uncharacterized protein n=1 Tax=Plasmopara halstedii TaxID=4781 RepID=A0A0P1AB08_PLAHL|nr:uncharacterized protein PHALS_05377 [Plasmopara halstedii]CEG37598.1 hypothetical protein PHALS_05377 [Plasmopara halstedii]|eukprot:XP_024573967.1 hypothetical protein PHALS_05377 [Plasmopara halstedii]
MEASMQLSGTKGFKKSYVVQVTAKGLLNPGLLNAKLPHFSEVATKTVKKVKKLLKADWDAFWDECLPVWIELGFSRDHVNAILRDANYRDEDVSYVLAKYDKLWYITKMESKLRILPPDFDAASLPYNFIISEDIRAAELIISAINIQRLELRLGPFDLASFTAEWTYLLKNWVKRNYSRERVQLTLEYAGINEEDIAEVVGIYDNLVSTTKAEPKATLSLPGETHARELSSVITSYDISAAKKLAGHANSGDQTSDPPFIASNWKQLFTNWIIRHFTQEQVETALRRAGLDKNELPLVMTTYNKLINRNDRGFAQINAQEIELVKDKKIDNAGIINLLANWERFGISRINVINALEQAGWSKLKMLKVLSSYDKLIN